MKVLIGADTYPPDINGLATFSRRLARGLAARGHQVHVLSASTTGPQVTEYDGSVVVHRIKSLRYPFHRSLRFAAPWLATPESERLIARLHPDVVHIQSHLVIGRGMARAARRADTPYVATNHFMPENVLGYTPFPNWIKPYVGRFAWRDLASVFGQAELITAPTQRAVQLLQDATGLRAEPVSNGIDSDRYWQAAEQVAASPAGRPTILFVGRLDPEKRVDELIRAYARLPRTVGAQLEIVGDGDQRPMLERVAVDLGVDDRVVFRGRVSDADLLAAYGRASVFCMPGIAELQSIVTLEAMSAGKPVVAADAMALPHLVHSGHNGWLYSPGDVGELAMRLSALITDPELCRRMGRHSREIVAHHSLAATIDRYEEIYQQACIRVPALLRAA
ncbi:glycosyltransferase [Microlunatus sp. Gsoil 973]|jgi:glycosyltransferase involved in cell wall biosynthesis|uniref:glycosyltransferase n=1 Tax=Microlunatus sp. Gsoil 973 TaxID=2672569 RepID=UPI0012B47782|nr:glycosyltransferase [Microlunatus sp. Gsoil 973]QGN31722.1 glycosyltransferase [Microlunatus sp. Gsoil 973]